MVVNRKTIAALVKAAGMTKPFKPGPGERIIRGVIHRRRPLCDSTGKAVMQDGQPQWEWVPKIRKEAKSTIKGNDHG